MIECVSIENNHCFRGNPIAAQHKLRFKSIIKRQGWDVPVIRDLEYDNYDNPAATYLIHRDRHGIARGVSRLYPTDRPYMLQEVFPHLVKDIDIPSAADVWEGSRFCVDNDLPAEERKRIIQEIVVSYLEVGLRKGLTHFIGVMYPVYWKNIFTRSGWNVDFVGESVRSSEGHQIRAGRVAVSEETLARVRDITGIREPVTDFGTAPLNISQAA